MRTKYFTAAGVAVSLELLRRFSHPDRDAEVTLYRVTSRDGSEPERLAVLLLAPGLIDVALQQAEKGTLEQLRDTIGLAVVLDAVDRRSELATASDGTPQIEVDVDDALALFSRARPSDRELRRLIARRCYETYASGTLDSDTNIDATDLFISGSRFVDFARNVGLLAAEEYVVVKRIEQSSGILIRGTAKLVREVEKFGAPREDASSDRNYPALIQQYPLLNALRKNVLAEYDRYAVALTAAELESVFRAAAPIVEAVARQALEANGCEKNLDTLGPIIQEIQRRNLVGPGTLAELRYVVKFTRDLAQHGMSLPESVLRIACETIFDVLPQLAAIAPRDI